jgi:cell wall-associated NlpC family hydrolase
MTLQREGVITVNVANMYLDANVKSEVVSQAIIGTTCVVKLNKEGWYYIQLPDTYLGWVPAETIRFYIKQDQPYASRGRVATIVNLFANINEGPSVDSPLMTTVTIGVTLEVPGMVTQDGWLHVRLPGGQIGWAQQGDVTVDNAPHLFARGKRSDYVAIAEKFLGLSYRWGGVSPFGIDCSGLAQLVYRLNGITILRDAGIQRGMKEFVPVPIAKMQPGDLIFFGNPTTKNITHVGIYIGTDKFIHATTYDHPVVQISKLADKHWTDLYVDSRHWTGK